MPIVKLSTPDGDFEFVDEIVGRGGMKDVYFSPDRSYVAAFYRHKLDTAAQDRLRSIVGAYRRRIFDQPGGEYWRKLYTWPSAIVEWQGRTGIIVPSYRSDFLFTYGSRDDDELKIRGREKEGKWFSAIHRKLFLDPRETGTWQSYFRIGLMLARAVRRLHAAGLAHSDLSYKNVLIDPVGGNACIIDIDGLVVPNKFPPEVMGTPEFIAPEVLATARRPRDDPARIHASIETDRHALAVLVYLYLLCRHPLRGSKVHDSDPARDEELMMGEAALFVEHPADAGNRIRTDQVKRHALPWADTAALPYTITGPRLAPLFLRAFTDGLHEPAARPSADEWEHALVRTVDLLQPCANADCEQKWFVADPQQAAPCPFCGTATAEPAPMLEMYIPRGRDTFVPEGHHLVAHDGQSVFAWHANRMVFPNERLAPEQRKRVGYVRHHKGEWLLVNERLPGMHDRTADRPVPVGGYVRLAEGQEILLDAGEGGRFVRVRIPMAAPAAQRRTEEITPPIKPTETTKATETKETRDDAVETPPRPPQPPPVRLAEGIGRIDWRNDAEKLQVGDLSGLDVATALCVTAAASNAQILQLAHRIGVPAAVASLLVLARADVSRKNWSAAVFIWALVPADRQPQLLDVARHMQMV